MLEKNDQIVRGGGVQCPACLSTKNRHFIDLGEVPISGNIIDNSCKTKMGEISLLECLECGFMWNSTFDPKKIQYESYSYNLVFSQKYTNHENKLINTLRNKYGIYQSFIIEIGCGNAHFLQMITKNTQSRGIGYEPSSGYSCPNNSNFVIKQEYYSGHSESVDLIICRHVLEHIWEPSSLIKIINKSLSKTKSNPLVVFEVPSLEYILKNTAFNNFIYEHCNYFSKQSLISLINRNGFKILDIHSCFDDAYHLVFFKKNISSKNSDSFLQKIEKLSNKNLNNNKIAIWGASNSGLLLYRILKSHNIVAFIDNDPNKQGKKMFSTNLPIFSPADACLHRIENVILSNNIYRHEITHFIKKNKLNIKILNITQQH